MNKIQRNEAGFGALGVVLVMVVLLAVGAAGWFVYSKNQDKNDTKTSTSNTTQKTPEATGAKSQADSNAGYLVVKEWDVRFKKSASTQDPKYVVKDEHTLYLTTETYLNKTNNACDANGDTGRLIRGKAGYKSDTYPDTVIENLTYSYEDNSGKTVTIRPVKVADYYYSWAGPQAGCAVPTDENVKIMDMYQQALADLVYTVESDE